MYVVGIDENGLGPKLGPLVATAVTIELKRYASGRLAEKGLGLGITDSKATAGFGKMSFAESIALALCKRRLGYVPRDVDDLLDALVLEGPLERRARCPDMAARGLCFGAGISLPAYGGDADSGEARLRALEGRTMRVTHVRSALACVSMLNEALVGGRSKLAMDLELFERLLIDARGRTEAPITAVCGMVGGIRDVPRFASVIDPARYVLAERDKTAIRYDVAEIGRVSFEVSADANHLPVALASIVGKYVRELTMGRIAKALRTHDEALPEPSGYHDPVTARFVVQSEALRRRLAIVDGCFARNG